MAEADWALMDNSIDANQHRRGVSAGFTPPNGGGTFIFGFHAQTNSDVSSGFYVNLTNFAPLAEGASIRGAIQRGTGGGTTAFAPIFFIGQQGSPPSINDVGYLIGLSDNDPANIVVRKGSVATGLDPTASDILATGSVSVSAGTWVHIRMDVINNPNGDVVINCFENDLSANAVTAPVWTAIPGISQIIDDALQVLTGTAPLTGGFVGYAMQSAGLNRRGFMDHLEVLRQV